MNQSLQRPDHKPALAFTDSSGQSFHVVSLQNRHSRLRNDGAVVVFSVDPMHGNSGVLLIRGEHRLVEATTVHAFAAVRRKKRRMRVEHASRIRRKSLWPDLLHVAGEQHELYSRFTQ